MRASELRIGNLIQENKDRETTIHVVDHVSIGYINHWLESVYQPIPITSDWLFKLGFNPPSMIGAYYYLDIASYTIDINLENGVVWVNNPPVEPFKNHTPIKNIHQLQNLVYALTGKELRASGMDTIYH